MLRPEESLLADHRSLLPRRLISSKAQIGPAEKLKNRLSLELSYEPNDCKRGLLVSKTTDSLTNSTDVVSRKVIRQDSADSLKRGLLSKTADSLTSSIELCPKKCVPNSSEGIKKGISEVSIDPVEICPRIDDLKRVSATKLNLEVTPIKVHLERFPTKEEPRKRQSEQKLVEEPKKLPSEPERKVSSSEQAKKLFFLAREGEQQCARRTLLPPLVEDGAGVRDAREERRSYGTLPHHSPDKTGGVGGAPTPDGGARGSPTAPRRALDYLLAPGLRLARRPQAVRRAASRDSALDASAAAAARVEPEDEGLRKCSTVLALSGRAEPLRATNRLRAPSLCSRCSSLLSLAGGSRYSLDATGGGGFVPAPLPEAPRLCKLCLEDAPPDRLTALHCGCAFCTRCTRAYVEFEVCNGAYEVSCPDAQCRLGGALSLDEIRHLVSADTMQKHLKFRLNHEVAMDRARAFCPRVGCDTVVAVRAASPAHCPACRHDFCADCNQEWHGGVSCSAAAEGTSAGPGAPLLPDSELIKWCPMCRVPIEKDEGCAQMMCKRCKHVFCWYCLASLDDDFLLRHYDKGPCKNKLGHSRASVIWHRAQVVGIFAGFGLLLLVASPLLLLAAPCIVCCKCRLCNPNGAKNLEEVDEAEGAETDKHADTSNEEISRARD